MCFFRILKLFFVTFFAFLTQTFFRALILQKCIGSMLLVPPTPLTGIADPFETLCVFLGWSDDTHVLFLKY